MFNTTRSPQAPPSLKNKVYNSKDVMDSLESMFFGKCYLCERDELTAPEIEHLEPHENDATKKYDWNNIFYACNRCNNIKSNTHKNLLDCCDPSVDVFRTIKCLLPSTQDGPIIVTAEENPNDQKTMNTVTLISRCYNEHNTPIRKITHAELVDKLFYYYTDILNYRRIIKDKKSTDTERNSAKDRIKVMLSDKFPFSVFWKWYILCDTFLLNEFNGDVGC